MADKTVNSGNFSLQIDNLKIEGLRSQAVYNVDPQGVVDGAQVNLTKEITKQEFDKLPDNSRTATLEQTAIGSPTLTTKYYAILATKKEDERTYTPNKEALDVTPLAKGATSPSDRDKALFNKEVAKFNSKGEGQMRTVSANANNAIIKEENFKPNDKRNRTGLAGNAAQPPAEPPPVVQVNPFAVKTNLRNFGNSRYPDKISDQQDRILFTMYEYGVKSGALNGEVINTQNQKIITGFGTREFKKPLGTVTLPLQSQITDSNRVEWGAGDLTPIEATLATSLMSSDISDIGKSFSGLEGKVKQAFKAAEGDLATAAQLYLIGQAIGNNSLLSRVSGGILNPNVELLFRGPTLRPFNFRFYLSPRSKNEAIQVKKIIRFFKEGMAVQETKTDIFLKAPNAFEIKYMRGVKTDHPGLNKIKKCALVSCNVDYTPDNSYMSFEEDGTMTAYAITMQFQELEPITSSDYSNDTTEIGY
jgi:hypothetical protein